MGMAPRPGLVDLSSDIPAPSRNAQLFKKALEKGKLAESVLKNPSKNTAELLTETGLKVSIDEIV